MTKDRSSFSNLMPDNILDAVEDNLKIKCTNLCRPLNSYINRVYELEKKDGSFLIVKFYRQNRWSYEALEDEHEFIRELDHQQIPVISPLKLANGSTLGDYKGLYYAVFPKKSGRYNDEFNESQWQELGRLIGRVHCVGELHQPRDRVTIAPDKSTRTQVDYLLNSNLIPLELKENFKEVVVAIIDNILPLFDKVEMFRIHGDCHFSNLIYRPDESFYVIDFDDMSVGPAVQDFWMLLPGYQEDCHLEINNFLEGYETFRNFDRGTLKLIEPLRAMRYIHYLAWCAHQVKEDGSSQLAGDFTSYSYWQNEINDLNKQLNRIMSSTAPKTFWY